MSKSSQDSTFSGKWLPGPNPPRCDLTTASPAAVRGGVLPSGGSTTSDAWRFTFPCSTQYEGGLMLRVVLDVTNSSLSASDVTTDCFCRSATSASVKVLLRPKLAGRCIG